MTGPNSELTSAPGDGMVLSSIAIRNFRSCYDTMIPFRRDVTVLVGENNSGSRTSSTRSASFSPHSERGAAVTSR